MLPRWKELGVWILHRDAFSGGIYRPCFGNETPAYMWKPAWNAGCHSTSCSETQVSVCSGRDKIWAKLSCWVVLNFFSNTRVLVWCNLKRAENELKTTHVFDHRLSLGVNARFQKLAFSACFQDENNLCGGWSTEDVGRDPGFSSIFILSRCMAYSPCWAWGWGGGGRWPWNTDSHVTFYHLRYYHITPSGLGGSGWFSKILFMHGPAFLKKKVCFCHKFWYCLF